MAPRVWSMLEDDREGDSSHFDQCGRRVGRPTAARSYGLSAATLLSLSSGKRVGRLRAIAMQLLAIPGDDISRGLSRKYLPDKIL